LAGTLSSWHSVFYSEALFLHWLSLSASDLAIWSAARLKAMWTAPASERPFRTVRHPRASRFAISKNGIPEAAYFDATPGFAPAWLFASAVI